MMDTMNKISLTKWALIGLIAISVFTASNKDETNDFESTDKSVHVEGYEVNASKIYITKNRKYRVTTALTEDSNNESGSTLFVSGKEVCSMCREGTDAKIWKNNMTAYCLDGSGSEFDHGIFVK